MVEKRGGKSDKFEKNLERIKSYRLSLQNDTDK